MKSPKVYLRDSGLLHHLLNISTHQDLDSHPIRGASWETFVIEDLLRRERVAHPLSQFFFWRTAAGAEIDLVVERGSKRYAVEVKSGRGDRPRTIHALESAARDVAVSGAFLVDQAAGRDPSSPGVERLGFSQALSWLPGTT